jgi:hypothetical protein
MLRDTQTIIAIIAGITGLLFYLYKLLKFVYRIDENTTALQKEMIDSKVAHEKEINNFKMMLFESDGRPKYVRLESCKKNREDIAKTIEDSFNLLQFRLKESLHISMKDTVKRIHEKIEKVEEDIDNLRNEFK